MQRLKPASITTIRCASITTGLWTGGLSLHALSADWEMRRLATDLFHAGLSEIGHKRLPHQFAIRFPGVQTMKLLISGNPRAGDYQIMPSGTHRNLRLGGKTREGEAFGGPQVYGDQRGNGRMGLPGNTYRYQMEIAHRIFGAMTPAERNVARISLAPPQTMIGVQAKEGHFDGVPIAELSIVNRRQATQLVEGILENYAQSDADYAWRCLEKNGGIDALYLADYDMDFQGGRRAGGDPSQIFRLEVPAAVFYFRGEPHLHAFLNVAMDGDNPLSVGDWLGDSPSVLEGESLRSFFESAMREQAAADLAFFLSVRCPDGCGKARFARGRLSGGELGR